MKNGCKDFISPTMDKLGITCHFENRLHDIIFAQTFLGIANNRGKCIEDSMTLIRELREYIVYLYSHIEQLEKDKRYLLDQRLKGGNCTAIKLRRIQEIISEKRGVADSQEFGLSYGQISNYLDQIEEVIK